jgi:hypothetical protein
MELSGAVQVNPKGGGQEMQLPYNYQTARTGRQD